MQNGCHNRDFKWNVSRNSWHVHSYTNGPHQHCQRRGRPDEWIQIKNTAAAPKLLFQQLNQVSAAHNYSLKCVCLCVRVCVSSYELWCWCGQLFLPRSCPASIKHPSHTQQEGGLSARLVFLCYSQVPNKVKEMTEGTCTLLKSRQFSEELPTCVQHDKGSIHVSGRTQMFSAIHQPKNHAGSLLCHFFRR